MASRSRASAQAPARNAPDRERRNEPAKPPQRPGAMREAVREIVRRYRETFERLGR